MEVCPDCLSTIFVIGGRMMMRDVQHVQIPGNLSTLYAPIQPIIGKINGGHIVK